MRTTFVSFQTLKRPALIGKTGFSQPHSVSSFLIRYGRISGQAQSLLEAAQSSACSLSLCNRSRFFFLSFFEKLLGAFYSDSIFLFTLFLDAGYIRQDLPNAVCSVQTKPDGDLLKDYLELVESRPPLGVLHQCHCVSQKEKPVLFSI